MTVVLRKQFKNGHFIDWLNRELATAGHAPCSCLLTTKARVEKEAYFFNNHPDGLAQLPHIKRSITWEFFSANFFWYKVGEFSLKLSGEVGEEDITNAYAICHWVEQTGGAFIDMDLSGNYDRATINEYLGEVSIGE